MKTRKEQSEFIVMIVSDGSLSSIRFLTATEILQRNLSYQGVSMYLLAEDVHGDHHGVHAT